jgi:hypothetical protein
MTFLIATLAQATTGSYAASGMLLRVLGVFCPAAQAARLLAGQPAHDSCRRAARDDASTSLAAKLRAMDGLRGFD